MKVAFATATILAAAASIAIGRTPCDPSNPQSCPTGTYCYVCAGTTCEQQALSVSACCDNGIHACCDILYSKKPQQDPNTGWWVYCIVAMRVDCDCSTIEPW